MKLKKLTSVLLALVMLTQLLPLSVFAGDSEEVLEYNITEEYTYTSTDTTDNDALLEGYVEQLFGISDNDGIMLTATYTGEDALSGINLTVYQTLKSAVADIAAGNTSSTIIELTLSNLTYSGSTFNDAVALFAEDFDFDLIIGYLVKDCPYEMYWYGNSCSANQNYYGYTSGSTSYLTSVDIAFTFNVASGYQLDGSETTVNTSLVSTAQTAVANAKEIVAEYTAKGYSDLELLTAYKEKICELVTYESNYSSYSYGDVWQLVYVFDGDSSTNVVCEGYSKAFQYLCDLSELECITVTGVMSGGTGYGNHMWNVVYLDDVNYLVDVTNSDEGTVGQNGGLFMVTDKDATASDETGYTFTITLGNYIYTITYAYDSDTTSIYPSSYLTLGSVSSGSGTTTVVPEIYGKALTLDGKIGVSYYFSMEGVENPKDYYLMAAVGSGAEAKYELNDTEEIDGVTYYYYTVYVGVADIDSTITAYLTDGTSTVDLSDYSVAEYCNLAIKEAWDEKALCEALLTYGYYAEIYKDGSSSITDYDDMTSYDVSDIDSTKYESSSPTGVAKALTLYDEICIKLYLTDAVVADSATFIVNGVTYTPVADTTVSGYTYSIEIPVPAKNMDLIYTIYKSDGTTVLTTYSVYTYIMNNTSGSTTNLTNLCRAIYNYSVAAENYTGWH